MRRDDLTAPLLRRLSCFISFGQAAFQTPVARRSRARPQSWHGTNPPPGSANAGAPRAGGDAGAMPAPMSAMSARSAAGGGGGGSVHGSSSKARTADHMLFYSVCQATFYVMCFRGDELAAMEGFGDQVAVPCAVSKAIAVVFACGVWSGLGDVGLGWMRKVGGACVHGGSECVCALLPPLQSMTRVPCAVRWVVHHLLETGRYFDIASLNMV